MENEAFLSMYSYGGGKRKKNDSDADYDPMNAKKRKERKRIRKKIERGKKAAIKDHGRKSKKSWIMEIAEIILT